MIALIFRGQTDDPDIEFVIYLLCLYGVSVFFFSNWYLICCFSVKMTIYANVRVFLFLTNLYIICYFGLNLAICRNVVLRIPTAILLLHVHLTKFKTF